MREVAALAFACITSIFESRVALCAENYALRHQLCVLQSIGPGFPNKVHQVDQPFPMKSEGCTTTTKGKPHEPENTSGSVFGTDNKYSGRTTPLSTRTDLTWRHNAAIV